MPVVPTKDTINVNVTSLSNPRFQNTQSMAEARIPGQQLEEFGKAQQRFGQVEADIALDIQREANMLRVDDAMNQAREEAQRLQYDKEAGFENLQGFDALNRPNGKPLADEYGENLQGRINGLAASLGNDAQRAAFTQQANDLLFRFKGSAIQHEGTQFREYAKSVREGTIKNRIQNIALNYDKPDLIAEDIVSIQANAKDLARQLGKAAVWGEAAAREQTSAAHMVVIETALQKENVKYADDYFKKYSSQMEPNDILRANVILGGELDNRLAVQTAGKVIESQIDNIVTPDTDRAFNIALGTESGGKQFGGPGSVAGPNEPTTSLKGAIGIAQVMPGTGPEAAKLAGLEWDENKFKNDAAYNRAIGKAYFEKQLKDFGSLAKAYAAYNAGPQALKDAINKAENAPAVDGEARKTWIDFLPAETQNYVNKNMNAFTAGKGKNDIPTLHDLQQQVRKEVGENSPKRLKLALDETERRYNEIVKAQEQENERAVANAMRAVLENGGDYAALPVNIRSNIPVEKITNVMDFAKKIATGDDTTNLWLYNKFTADPQKLIELTDDQFFALRAELSESDFKHFAQERGKILTGNLPEGTSPGSLNTSAIKNAIDTRLRLIGVDPAPPDTKKGFGGEKFNSEAARVGAVRKFVNEAILAAQNETGKKFNDSEVEQFIDKLFARNSTYQGIFKTSGPMLGMTADQIPKMTKVALEAAFEKKGITPTDSDLLNAYWGQMLRTGQKAAAKGTF
ncbi:MAG: transglycosylase SLT domain-containing protein [Alphaproteobacteria bacterium]|nr:transglycosylase SLT domain-containing protein [Alphaproteobacteria bacterium]